MLLHVFVKYPDISLIQMTQKKRGNPRLDEVRNNDVTAANLERARLTDEHAETIVKAVIELQNVTGGGMSYGRYAKLLNVQGYRTRRGKFLTGRQISRIMKRYTSGKAKPKNPVRRSKLRG
jgi:hypothetical protein